MASRPLLRSLRSLTIQPFHNVNTSSCEAASQRSYSTVRSSGSKAITLNFSTTSKAQDGDGRARPLSEAQQEFLDRALRVNQAGELAAVLIYDAQTPPIVRTHPHLKDMMAHMQAQEASHFHTFNDLLAKHRIRPTVMYPVWRLAATALGWGTAVMGKEAAMACTEAVETEIGEHYNRQVVTLLKWAKETEDSGGTVSPEFKELVSTLRRIRDEELEHLDTAVDNDAKEAKPYELLTGVIRGDVELPFGLVKEFDALF